MKRHLLSRSVWLCLAFFLAFTGFVKSQQNIVYCPVFQQDYATGSCSSTAKTQNSIIKAYGNGGDRGWAKFDISNIPDSVSINNIKVHFYSGNQSYPYYFITKLPADPVTTAGSNLFSIIGLAIQSPPNIYLQYTGNPTSGWNIRNLNNNATNDLMNALQQNWFALGFYEYETSGNYYFEAHGWNQSYEPYLEVSYTPLSFTNDLAITAITSPAGNTCNDTVSVEAVIYNNGTNAITSAIITATRYNQLLMDYTYTSQGLLPGNYDTITLGDIVFPYGYNQLALSVTTVNTYSDPNFSNNSQAQYFSVLENATLTQQPNNQNVLVGANVSFAVEVSGYYYQSYHWQLSTDGGLTYTDLINGNPYYYVDSSQMQVVHVQPSMNNYLFRCRIESFCNTVFSNAALLTVFQGPLTVMGCWATQDSVCAGSTSQVNVSVAGGTGNYVYIWSSNPPGFTAATADPFVNPDQTTQYFCTIHDGNDTVNASCWVYAVSVPDSAGPITGPSTICNGATEITYSIAPVQGADYYYWTLPNGLSSNNIYSNQININVSNNFQSGYITARGVNYCGYGLAAHYYVAAGGGPLVNAGPDQTIYAGSSATLSATVSMGIPPFVFTWNNGMTGPSIIVTPSATTIYTVTVTDSTGCSSSDQVVVHVNTSVVLVTSLGNNVQCQGNVHIPIHVSNFFGVAAASLSLVYDTSQLLYTGYQGVNSSLSSGTLLVNAINDKINIAWFSLSPVTIGSGILMYLTFQADTGVSTMNWDLQTQGACQYSNINNITIPSVFYGNDVVIQACSNVQGYVHYENNLRSPMTNTPVYLMQSGNIAYETISDSTGHYTFTNLADGTYHSTCLPGKPWGSVNASDALLILKHFVSMETLSGITLQAGDVDLSSAVNGTDGLLVAKRFVGMVDSFPAGDWISEGTTFTIDGSGNIADSIVVICTGDVDRSYLPAYWKTEPAVELYASGKTTPGNKGQISVPFRTCEPLKVSSITLVMDFQSDYLIPVNIILGNDEPVMFTFKDHQIKMAWYSLTPLELQKDDILFNIICNYVYKTGTLQFVPRQECMITDDSGNPYVKVKLCYDKPLLSETRDYLGNCYPNPIENFTDLTYQLGEDGLVQIALTDVTGNLVQILVDNKQLAGTYTIRISGNTLTPGMYFCRVKVSHGDKVYTESRKLLKK